MRPTSIIPFLASAGLGLALTACDNPTPVAPASDGVPSASAVIAQNLLYRHPGRLTFLDDQNDWDVLLLGYDPADDNTCNGGVWVGGIPILEHIAVTHADETFDLGSGSTWGRGEGFHDLVTTIGRPPLYMYSRASLPPDNAPDEVWCDYLTNDWIAAGGWSATIGVDNDITGDDGTPGINTWGGTEVGQLVGTDGTRYRYEFRFRAQYDPGVAFRVLFVVDHVVRVGQ